MKAKRILISILTVAALLMIVSCSPRVMDELIHSGVSYKVIFDPGNGTWHNTSLVTDPNYDQQTDQYYRVVGYNSSVSVPPVNPKGHDNKDFAGWTLNGTPFPLSTKITSDITLVATYK